MIDFGSLLGAGTSLLGGLFGGGAGNAAQQGAEAGQKTDWWAMANTNEAVDNAVKAYQNAYTNAQGYLQPYYNAGQQGLNSLSNALTPASGLSQTDMVSGLPPGAGANLMDFLTKTQAYQFPLQQGLTLLDQSAAARGNALSGGQQQAITQYGQNFAMSNALAPAQANYQNYLNNLYGKLAAPGQVAGTQIGQFGMQSAAGQAGARMTGAQLQNSLASNIAGLQSNAGQAEQATSMYNQNALGSQMGALGGLISQVPWNQIGVGSSYGGTASGPSWNNALNTASLYGMY